MPRHPLPAPAVAQMPGAVFSRLAPRIAALGGDVYPLHVGDTWMQPFEGGRMEDIRSADHPGLHRYTRPEGLPALIDAVVDKVRARNGLRAERGSVLITSGATGGLGAAVGMLAAPDEEILILAPFWPLIRGIVSTFRATPVEVPFFGRVDSPESAVAAIREKLTERSVALYISTPSNPSGQLIPRAWLEAIAELARAEGLWLLSDEVYEDYVFEGEHVSIGAMAPERTFTAFSFSKAYGMAGNRTGYLVGPEEAMNSCRKISTHTCFSAPTAGQVAGLRALQGAAAWVDEARESYKRAGYAAADALGVPRPRGSTFLFLDVSAHLDERGVFGFLEDALDDGLVMAPGPSFGADYHGHVRLCYTSAPPARVGDAIALLARRLGRLPGETPCT